MRKTPISRIRANTETFTPEGWGLNLLAGRRFLHPRSGGLPTAETGQSPARVGNPAFHRFPKTHSINHGEWNAEKAI